MSSRRNRRSRRRREEDSDLDDGQQEKRAKDAWQDKDNMSFEEFDRVRRLEGLRHTALSVIHYHRFFLVTEYLSLTFVLFQTILNYASSTYSSTLIAFSAGVAGVLATVFEQYSSYATKLETKRQKEYDEIMDGKGFGVVATNLEAASKAKKTEGQTEQEEEVEEMEEVSEQEETTTTSSRSDTKAYEKVLDKYKFISKKIVEYAGKAPPIRHAIGRKMAFAFDRIELAANLLEACSNFLVGAAAVIAFTASTWSYTDLGWIAGGVSSFALVLLQLSYFLDSVAEQSLLNYRDLLKLDLQAKGIKFADKKSTDSSSSEVTMTKVKDTA